MASWLGQWLPGSWLVLVSFPGEMTAEKSVKPFSAPAYLLKSQGEVAGAVRPVELARSGGATSWWPGLSEVSAALAPMQGDACLK